MCVAVEGDVLETDGSFAIVDVGGARIRAASGLVAAAPGDHVLVHAGCILQRITEEERETITDLSDLLRRAGAY